MSLYEQPLDNNVLKITTKDSTQLFYFAEFHLNANHLYPLLNCIGLNKNIKQYYR